MYILWYRSLRSMIRDSAIGIDLRKNVVYDIVDYDKNYSGLQLILDNKAIRFDSIPSRIVPMIYNNKLFGVEFINSNDPKIVAPIQDIPNIEVFAIQVGSAILPISVDPKSVLKPKEDYQAEVFDLLWRLINKKAGTTVDQMLKDAKKYIHEFKDSKKSYDFR